MIIEITREKENDYKEKKKLEQKIVKKRKNCFRDKKFSDLK